MIYHLKYQYLKLGFARISLNAMQEYFARRIIDVCPLSNMQTYTQDAVNYTLLTIITNIIIFSFLLQLNNQRVLDKLHLRVLSVPVYSQRQCCPGSLLYFQHSDQSMRVRRPGSCSKVQSLNKILCYTFKQNFSGNIFESRDFQIV